MRPILATLLLTSTLALACGGPVTPSHERGERAFSDHAVPTAFEGLDLPWYGGLVERSSERSMTVSYSDTEATVEQLRAWWPAALADAGWTEEHRTLAGDGSLIVYWSTSDGRDARLSIAPEGSLWWVHLIVDI